MLRTRRLPAARLCLLIAGIMLLSTTGLALATDAAPVMAVASAHAHGRVPAHAHQRRKPGKSSASARRARCIAAARRKHHKVGKACAAKKASKRRAPKLAVPVSRRPAAAAAPPAGPVAPVGLAGPFRFFSPTSVWNEELSPSAPLDPSSAAVVGAFDEEITKEAAAKKSPAINTTEWSVPVYTVPAGQQLVKVTQTFPYGGKVTPTLQSAWDAVPLPSDAQPAAGTDKHLVVWQPSTNKLWEFWHLEETLTGWQAKWGGAIENASASSGAYGPEAWHGATTSWGASASSLSIAGGLITLEDLEKGQINHALAMALPDTRAGVYASPAERTDGGDTGPLSLPEGAHLRLDPNLDLAALHLPKLTLMLAEAAQRYGIVVRDSASNVAFYGQDPTPTGTNPYTGVHGYFEGKSPQQILESFPWNHLQLLKMELHYTS